MTTPCLACTLRRLPCATQAGPADEALPVLGLDLKPAHHARYLAVRRRRDEATRAA